MLRLISRIAPSATAALSVVARSPAPLTTAAVSFTREYATATKSKPKSKSSAASANSKTSQTVSAAAEKQAELTKDMSPSQLANHLAKQKQRERKMKKKQQAKLAARRSHPRDVVLNDAVSILKAFEVGNHYTHRFKLTIGTVVDRTKPTIRGSVHFPHTEAPPMEGDGVQAGEEAADQQQSQAPQARILVFAEGEAAKAALDAGATVVGGEELIQAIQNGQDPLQYTKVISTLALYPAVTKIARILGPRGLMPSMRDGTVTANVANVVAASLGATEFKANRAGYIRIPLGPIALTTEQIRANVNAIVDTLEPHLKAAKKLEVTGVFLKSTNGPDLRIRDFVQAKN